MCVPISKVHYAPPRHLVEVGNLRPIKFRVRAVGAPRVDSSLTWTGSPQYDWDVPGSREVPQQYTTCLQGSFPRCYLGHEFQDWHVEPSKVPIQSFHGNASTGDAG